MRNARNSDTDLDQPAHGLSVFFNVPTWSIKSFVYFTPTPPDNTKYIEISATHLAKKTNFS